MKKLLVSLVILTSSMQTLAMGQNLYAPTLKDVTVLYDSFERDFSPFLFHWIMGEALDMKMHDSCKKIRVNEGIVSCISASGASVVVGQLGSKVGNQQEWQAIQVKWNNKVKILETKVNDRSVFQLMITSPLF